MVTLAKRTMGAWAVILCLAAAAAAAPPQYAVDFFDATHCTSVDVSADGTKLYARHCYADWDEGFRTLDAHTGALLAEYHVHVPWVGLVSADGAHLWADRYYMGDVVKLNLATGLIDASVYVGSWPAGLAFDSTKQYLYVSQNVPGTYTTGSLKEVDTLTNTVVATLPLNGEPWRDTVVSPDDQFVYVSTWNADTVYKVRTSDFAWWSLSVPGKGYRQMAMSPDGSVLYVPDASGYLNIVDTATMSVTDQWSLPSPAAVVVLSPDGSHALLLHQASSVVEVFDMTTRTVVQILDLGSLVAWGGVRYAWDAASGTAYVPLCEGAWSLAVFRPDRLVLDIDIKPGSDPNSVNLGANGVIPVAILGSEEFDVTTINQTTLTFAGSAARSKGKSGNIGALEDVNEDGFMDLVVQFPTEGLELSDSDTEASVVGYLLDGTPVIGTDSIRIVPPAS